MLHKIVPYLITDIEEAIKTYEALEFLSLPDESISIRRK